MARNEIPEQKPPTHDSIGNGLASMMPPTAPPIQEDPSKMLKFPPPRKAQ